MIDWAIIYILSNIILSTVVSFYFAVMFVFLYLYLCNPERLKEEKVKLYLTEILQSPELNYNREFMSVHFVVMVSLLQQLFGLVLIYLLVRMAIIYLSHKII
jgi:hypothetical protein